MAEATEAPVIEQQPAPEAPAEAVVTDAPKDEAAQAPAETPEHPAETPTDEQPARPGKNRYQRRLDAATRKYYEEKARADFLEKQYAELKPKAAPADAGTPRIEQFSDIEEYATAKAKYEREQGIKEYETQQRAQSQKREQERIAAEWEKKADRGSSKYDDFDEVVGTLQPVNALVAAVMEADNAEDIAYYLAKHPKEASEITQLGPLAQIRAIGRLEAKLSSEPPKPKTPSKAPAPITPVGGKSGGSSDLPQDSDDINTWMKKANAESKRRMSGA